MKEAPIHANLPFYISISFCICTAPCFSPRELKLVKTWKIFSSLISESRITKKNKTMDSWGPRRFSDSAESRHFCVFWEYLRSEDSKRQFYWESESRKLEIRTMKLYQFEMGQKQTLLLQRTFFGTGPQNRTSNSVFSRLPHMLSSYVWSPDSGQVGE